MNDQLRTEPIFCIVLKKSQLQSGQKTVGVNKNIVSEGIELFKEIL